MPSPSKKSKESLFTGKIIKSLMEEANICEAELARLVDLPQPTVHSLLSGATRDPRSCTLIPIAKFFGVTIGQLLGQEPISKERLKGSYQVSNRSAWMALPIITWEEVNGWLFKKEQATPSTHQNWINTELACSNDAFALATKPYMSPIFRKDSILLLDPKKEAEDGAFALVLTPGETMPVLKEVVQEGSTTYFQSLNPGMPAEKRTPQHQVLGVVFESRMRF
tara:strand:- start:94279 stop:94947 length:669 start_codon:yes stop_codon:yes gene_type:complete